MLQLGTDHCGLLISPFCGPISGMRGIPSSAQTSSTCFLRPSNPLHLQVRSNPACQAQPDLRQLLVAALPRLRQLDGVDVEGMAEGASPTANQVEADSRPGAAEGSNEDQGRDGEQACPGSQLLPSWWWCSRAPTTHSSSEASDRGVMLLSERWSLREGPPTRCGNTVGKSAAASVHGSASTNMLGHVVC